MRPGMTGRAGLRVGFSTMKSAVCKQDRDPSATCGGRDALGIMPGVVSPLIAGPNRLSRDPVLGQTVLGYHVTALIKAGRTARIYAAHCLQSGEPVALKMLRPVLRADRVVVDAFEREQAVLRRASHRGIPRFRASGWFRGVPWYVMDRLSGESLAKVVVNGPLSTPNALQVMARVCSALDHLHRAGLVHGALSASAVLVSPAFDEIALLDLSHARPLCNMDDVQGDLVAAGTLLAELAGRADPRLRAIVDRCSYASPNRYSAIVELESDLRGATGEVEPEEEITRVYARAC